MKTAHLNVGEITETRQVEEANGLLQTGWRLLEIACSPRGHVYILGARTTGDEERPAHATLQHNT